MEEAAIRVPVPPSWGHAGEQGESQRLSDQKPAKTPSFMLTYVSFFSSVLHFPEARSTFNLSPNVLLWLLKASIRIHPKSKKYTFNKSLKWSHNFRFKSFWSVWVSLEAAPRWAQLSQWFQLVSRHRFRNNRNVSVGAAWTSSHNKSQFSTLKKHLLMV